MPFERTRFDWVRFGWVRFGWVRFGWVVAVAASLMTAALVGPWGSRMLDLEIYRLGASALLDGRDLYSVSDAATGLPFTYPVFAAVVFVPFAIVPTLVARIAITLLSLAALVLVCYLTLRHRRPRDRTDAPRPATLVWVWLAAAASHPVLDTLLFGQVNLLLVALVLADVFLVRGRLRGVGVGLATGIKLTPGLFVVYYLVTGQRREARNAALAAAGTVLIGLVVQPDQTWQFFTRHIFEPTRTGNVTYAGNQSILATVARLLRDPHPSSVLTLSLSAIVVVAALLLARRFDRAGERLIAVSVTAAAALLVSPISWTHHWVWAIPCLGVVTAWAQRRRHWAAVGVAVVVVWTGPMRFMPKNDMRELQQNLPQQIVTNSFVLLALAFLGWAAWMSWRSRAGARSGQTAPSVASAPTVA